MLPVVGSDVGVGAGVGVGGGRLSPQPLVHVSGSVLTHVPGSGIGSSSGVPMVGHRRSVVLGSVPQDKKQD